jgi:hypothetical protein
MQSEDKLTKMQASLSQAEEKITRLSATPGGVADKQTSQVGLYLALIAAVFCISKFLLISFHLSY